MVRFVEDGGDASVGEPEDAIAPVIPLFGANAPKSPRIDSARAAGWHSTWDAPDRERGSGSRELPESVAPLRELPGSVDGMAPARATEPEPLDPAEQREAAEKRLLKKLRTRSLSIYEARGVLREGGLDSAHMDEIIDAFAQRGYLDDPALAEQLVHAAVDRKGQGRRAIAQTLAKRGVARDVADAAIASLPDDDADRALDFARTKARSMSKLDPDTALRRLMGQLARRGYGGGIAMNVAKQALSEQSGGPRFR